MLVLLENVIPEASTKYATFMHANLCKFKLSLLFICWLLATGIQVNNFYERDTESMCNGIVLCWAICVEILYFQYGELQVQLEPDGALLIPIAVSRTKSQAEHSDLHIVPVFMIFWYWCWRLDVQNSVLDCTLQFSFIDCGITSIVSTQSKTVWTIYSHRSDTLVILIYIPTWLQILPDPPVVQLSIFTYCKRGLWYCWKYLQ